jgi:sigma-B regulation protein RsbU (phosphoserine phosphatase)
MDQHKLYRTIKILGEAKFRTEEELLGHILQTIIQGEEFPIRGGRIWKLDPSIGSYRLKSQFGEIESIQRNFRIRVLDYPVFLQLPKKGTIVSIETNKYLRERGIRHYSATGVGEKVQWKGYTLFQYVIAINADFLKQDMLYALNIIGNALTAALQNRRMESKAKQLERDIDEARAIQKSILPEHELRFHHYDIYGISLPDRVVGGDFFDYLQTADDKDRLAVVIGDAASKGLSAAAQALYVSGALRMGIEFQMKISTLVSRINQLVNKTFTPEHFISMVYAELTSSDNGLVFYVNAGHSNPILLHANTDIAEPLRATGQLIGPFPNEKYRAEYALMRKGDVLLMYTDGIVEAMNEQREMYGEQRLIKKLREQRSRTPKEICQLVLEDVQIHNRLVDYSDDKTIVVIKRNR